MVGVGFERTSPVNAIGDGHGEEEGGVAGEFDETLGRSKEEKMAIVGLLELHDFGFDDVLTLLEGDAGGRNLLSGSAGRLGFLLLLEGFECLFKFLKG